MNSGNEEKQSGWISGRGLSIKSRLLRLFCVVLLFGLIAFLIDLRGNFREIILINYSSDTIEIEIKGTCRASVPPLHTKHFNTSGCYYVSGGDMTVEITYTSTGRIVTKHFDNAAIKSLTLHDSVVVLEFM